MRGDRIVGLGNIFAAAPRPMNLGRGEFRLFKTCRINGRHGNRGPADRCGRARVAFFSTQQPDARPQRGWVVYVDDCRVGIGDGGADIVEAIKAGRHLFLALISTNYAKAKFAGNIRCHRLADFFTPPTRAAAGASGRADHGDSCARCITQATLGPPRSTTSQSRESRLCAPPAVATFPLPQLYQMSTTAAHAEKLGQGPSVNGGGRVTE